MADLSHRDTHPDELMAGLEHIEAQVRLVREMCGDEPEFEMIIKHLKAVRRSIEVVSKILQYTYISRRVLRHAREGGSARCLSDLCRRVMAERSAALWREQKMFSPEQIPPPSNSINKRKGEGRGL